MTNATTETETEAERIAAKLTEAQRRVALTNDRAFSDQWKQHWHSLNIRTAQRLWKLALALPSYADGIEAGARVAESYMSDTNFPHTNSKLRVMAAQIRALATPSPASSDEALVSLLRECREFIWNDNRYCQSGTGEWVVERSAEPILVKIDATLKDRSHPQRAMKDDIRWTAGHAYRIGDTVILKLPLYRKWWQLWRPRVVGYADFVGQAGGSANARWHSAFAPCKSMTYADE